MTYTKLPFVNESRSLSLPHFPNRFYAAVFRFWETVDASRIAAALGTSAEVIREAAAEMGLPPQRNTDCWRSRGYITTIRNAWYLLPYEQLLTLLDWSEDKLATVLKEDDFLDVKLGEKPFCPPVVPEPLTAVQRAQLACIKKTMQMHFKDMFDGAAPFSFFQSKEASPADGEGDVKGLRLIYSYCGLYANVLEQDISLSYPDELLSMYRAAGVNAIWLPVVLYQMVPFYFDESYSAGWQDRVARLRELIGRAKAYGIEVYLYLNEPRCMPMDFFKKYRSLQGKRQPPNAALCSSDPRTLEYLRYAVRTLCEAVPGLGGFFTITCSENLTHCKSRKKGEPCPRCQSIPVSKLVSDVIIAISETSRAVDPQIRTIAWTWAWENFMSSEEISDCLSRLPREVIVQCNSEAGMPFTVGGISGTVQDYSMSIPGSAPMARSIWEQARALGHDTCAKVQVNVTWECSTVPFLPVFDLIREHMSNLREEGVEHLMLSWTLGGYPSINLKAASSCLKDPSEETYRALLKEEYGAHADTVFRAARLFSDAFRQFPFHIGTLYHGPQNAGPSTLLYATPTGLPSTMTCYAFDDLKGWRSIYPAEVFEEQLRLLSEGWQQGLELLKAMPDCDLKRAAWGGYALFRSSYLQTRFIRCRDEGDRAGMRAAVAEERELALLMYDLMQASALFGYEAANHYYFNKGMMAEKVLNCELLLDELKL